MRKLLAVFTIAALVACSSEKKQEPAPPQEITVVNVIQKDVPIYNEMVGQIYGLKDIPIRARVDGFLEKISFDEGSRVEKGQLLYSIDPQPFLASVAAQESKVSEAQTLMVNAKNELDRYIPLAKMNAVSKSDLDAAQANYDAAIASLDAAKANLTSAKINLGYCSIHAPIAGMIGKTEAREGEYVGKEPNPVILNTLSRVDTVRVQFSISESKYLEVSRAYTKDLTDEEARKRVEEKRINPNINLILSDGSTYNQKGKIDFINSQIDATTGSLLIQASFPNPSRLLRPGLYAKVRIQLGVEENAMVIPRRCLIEIQGKYSVVVIDDQNTASTKSIAIGETIGDLVIVSEGLEAGDKVVIDALQKVMPGMVVNPQTIEFESKTNP